MNEASRLRVALLGAGTVGGSVARALLDRRDGLARAGTRLELVGIAVRDLDRAAARGLPGELLTDAPAHLVASPEVDVVVEVLGGEEPARTLIRAALGAGKAVVTANKHVLAMHGAELEAAARDAGAALRFEAAVGGGIPILAPLAGDLAGNRIDVVRGIVNGTTNYILSAMAGSGRAYEGALAAAQKAGFAEADPTGDVEGGDAVDKLVILARLAFGRWLAPASIERRPPAVEGSGRPGISGVTPAEVAAAAQVGLAIKLIAGARLAGGDAVTAGALLTGGEAANAADAPAANQAVTASVLPSAVLAASPFGRTSGVINRIEIDGEPIGRVAFEGPGAGGGPTSSAVLGDLLALARGEASTWAGLPPATDPVLAAAPDGRPRRRFFATLLPDQLVRDQVEIEAARGGGFISAAAPLDELRAALASAGVEATLYPIED